MRTPSTLVVTLLTALVHPAYAQEWQWAHDGQSAAHASAGGVTVDGAGSGVVVGNYHDAITLDGTALSAPGMDAIYLARYAPDGSLQWAVTAAQSTSITAHSVHVGADGRIAVAGLYLQGALIGGTDSVHAVGDMDAFTAEYDAQGQLLWVRTMGGPGFDYGASVTHDPDGNVLMHGEEHISSWNFSASKLFVVKYDAYGNTLWTTYSDSFGTQHLANGIAMDAEGNSYITGCFFNALTLGPYVLDGGTPELTIYAASLTPEGTFRWARQAGAGGYGGGLGIAVDAEAHAYVSGFYRGNAAFGTHTLPGPTDPSYDAFLAKCDTDGTFLWAIGAGAPQVSDMGSAVAVTPEGHPVLAGSFGGTLHAGIWSVTGAGGSDAFVAEADAQGQILWLLACGGAGTDLPAAIAASAQGILVAGGVQGAVDVGPDIQLPGAAAVSRPFVALIKEADVSGVPEVGPVAPVLFPDPAEDRIRSSGARAGSDYRLLDDQGRLVGQGRYEADGIAVEGLAPGTYILVGSEAERTWRVPFVKR